jgi:hypothetical protein
MENDRKKRGRPKSAVDIEQLEKLAGLACTIEEAAAFLGISKRTLLRRLEDPRFKQVWEDGLLKGNVSLRRRQWAIAQSDSPSAVTMLLHLSRFRLGQHDKSLVEITGKNSGPLQVFDLANMTHEQLVAKAEELGLPKKLFDD